MRKWNKINNKKISWITIEDNIVWPIPRQEAVLFIVSQQSSIVSDKQGNSVDKGKIVFHALWVYVQIKLKQKDVF